MAVQVDFAFDFQVLKSLVDFLQHLMPTLGSSDDVLRIGLPDEGPAALIVLLDQLFDGGLQGGDSMEDAAQQLSPAQLGERALDGVEPRRRSWSEMETPARVAGELMFSLRMFVHGIVVEHGLDQLVLGYFELGGFLKGEHGSSLV